jgi:creatinine amidohydrolase
MESVPTLGFSIPNVPDGPFWNLKLVQMEWAEFSTADIPEFLLDSFAKKDGAPDVEFMGYTYFNFPMDHHEFAASGVIGNPLPATAEK